MRVQLLGSGGADGIPALFGSDRVSRNARAVGGREVRSRASALVDGVLKLDLPPETLAQCHAHGVDATEWEAILFTHSDDDHLAVNGLQYALYPFTAEDHAQFAIYGNAAVVARIRTRFPDWPIETHETRAFCPVETHGYAVTPVLATHSPGEECHNLLIERAGRRFLYATDTGVYGEATFDFLAGVGVHALVIECTDGVAGSEYPGHLSLATLAPVLERLRESGALAPRARVVTTHHSARGGATHAELLGLLAPLGAEPGYDGLTFEV